jgi:sec-independent protein translocase protein TatA
VTLGRPAAFGHIPTRKDRADGLVQHWPLAGVVLAVVLILFCAGRLPQTMGDLAKGIRSFKKGMREDVPPIADKSAKGDPPADGKAA